MIGVQTVVFVHFFGKSFLCQMYRPVLSWILYDFKLLEIHLTLGILLRRKTTVGASKDCLLKEVELREAGRLQAKTQETGILFSIQRP